MRLIFIRIRLESCWFLNGCSNLSCFVSEVLNSGCWVFSVENKSVLAILIYNLYSNVCALRHPGETDWVAVSIVCGLCSLQKCTSVSACWICASLLDAV